MTIHLTAARVKEKARESYLKGELQAQKEPKMRRGRYSGPCAIGVALTPAEMEQIAHMDANGIGKLVDRGLITVDDLKFLMDLQDAHDTQQFGRLERLLEIDGETK